MSTSAAAAADASPGAYAAPHDGSTISAGPPASGTTTGRADARASSTAIPNGSRGAQCRRHVARASAPRGSGTWPSKETAPARSGCAARARSDSRSASPAPSSGAPSTRRRRSGTACLAIDTASSARSGRFQPTRAPNTTTSGGSAGGPSSSAKRSASTPGKIDVQPARQPPAGIEIARDGVGRRHHQGGPRRGGPDRRADQPARGEVVVDERVRPPGGTAARGQQARDRGPHPPGHQQVGLEAALQAPDLGGVRHHRPRGAQPHRRARAQFAGAVRQDQGAQARRAGLRRQRSLRTGDERVPRDGGRPVEQETLRAARSGRVADEQDPRQSCPQAIPPAAGGLSHRASPRRWRRAGSSRDAGAAP